MDNEPSVTGLEHAVLLVRAKMCATTADGLVLGFDPGNTRSEHEVKTELVVFCIDHESMLGRRLYLQQY